MDFWLKLSVRVRLILLFVAIKVVPLMFLMWVAWSQMRSVGEHFAEEFSSLVETANESVHKVGEQAIDDAVSALDSLARDEIERLTTDTANRVADFLYGRDVDIRYVATIQPNETAYRKYIDSARRDLIFHGKWKLNENKTDWVPEELPAPERYVPKPGSNDNAILFHYRSPVVFKRQPVPLYVEMTFIGLDGQEQVKVTTSPKASAEKKDVSQRRNTFARAETYFADLKALKPGEIYVSEVIGRYVGSKIIGKFTPEAAKKAGIPFEPTESAYAGKENPVGKRFQGIVRWATPVVQGGKIIGWVTLALNHEHLMSFTDHIVPSAERYRDINDAFDGNYAFIWDYKGRSIVHPRHHSIVGYDENGEPAIPWLENSVYEAFKNSGKPWREFMQTAPTFVNQRQTLRPAAELTKNGNVGLDCRWLNFAPQCVGWYNLANQGGSGSFLILWSGLYKLTTTAAIPYYTGRYSPDVAGNRRGFGIVTIGANVNDFHRAASESKARLDNIIAVANERMLRGGHEAHASLRKDMMRSAFYLSLTTLVLIAAVILIAIWIASFLSQKIGWLNEGLNRYRFGEKGFRFQYRYNNEITSLASTFNEMADALNQNVARLEREIGDRTRAEGELRDIRDNLEVLVDERTLALSEANRMLSSEINIRRIAEEKAQYLAGHDPLTGLANRMLFNEQLKRAVGQIGRIGKQGALLFFDLDHFKQVNDTLGHSVGDALLIHMASILKGRVRCSDTAARLGGDEFAVVMTCLDEPSQAAILAQDILNKLKEPFFVGDTEMKIRSSIGIAPIGAGDGADDPEVIIHHADMAMYMSKTQGGMRYSFFEPTAPDSVDDSGIVEKELRGALGKREFTAFFQPLYDIVLHKPLYLEVLARWCHPIKGLLLPGEFMDSAERYGLSREIDTQVLHLALSLAHEWLSEKLFEGRISFNVSPFYLEQPDFVQRFESALQAHDIAASYVAIDISEYVLLRESGWTLKTLTALREKGIEVIIDRLVFERSTIGSLFDHAVDAIKIDRSFTGMLDDPKVASMITTIADIAHSTGMRLIAEGVENETQWDFFQKLQCTIIQGFKHARPMNAEDTRAYLVNSLREAAKLDLVTSA